MFCGYVNQSSLSHVNERRDWQIFGDFGQYLIDQARPLYTESKIPNINLDNEVFALDTTAISISLMLFSWALVKYAKGTVKIHILLDLRRGIP